mmetsp:Transcript_13675/g.39851  ORF Transcript_13675/g.39851 Transcript_13675/m.39851 type:complete len:304 (+) Transcript_13675:498-1409(+)
MQGKSRSIATEKSSRTNLRPSDSGSINRPRTLPSSPRRPAESSSTLLCPSPTSATTRRGPSDRSSASTRCTTATSSAGRTSPWMNSSMSLWATASTSAASTSITRSTPSPSKKSTDSPGSPTPSSSPAPQILTSTTSSNACGTTWDSSAFSLNDEGNPQTSTYPSSSPTNATASPSKPHPPPSPKNSSSSSTSPSSGDDPRNTAHSALDLPTNSKTKTSFKSPRKPTPSKNTPRTTPPGSRSTTPWSQRKERPGPRRGRRRGCRGNTLGVSFGGGGMGAKTKTRSRLPVVGRLGLVELARLVD